MAIAPPVTQRDIGWEGYLELCGHIIDMAARDYKLKTMRRMQVNQYEDESEWMGFKYGKTDVLEFIKSGWFCLYAGALDCDCETARRGFLARLKEG